MAAKVSAKSKRAAKVKPKKAAVKKAAKVPAKVPAAVARVSDDTLERLPGKVVTFLMAVGTVPEIRAVLVARGYTDAVHQEGWRLLEQVAGRSSLAPPPAAVSEGAAAASATKTVEEARDAIESWVSINLGVADAALKLNYPAQHAHVFAGKLKAERGAKAVLVAQSFLSRIESLDGSRKGVHADDVKALATLGERGIDAGARAGVRELLGVVQEGAPSGAPALKGAAVKAGSSSQAAKLALYAWHSEWAGIAQSVVTRRDYRIRLGIAARRKAKKPAEPPAVPK